MNRAIGFLSFLSLLATSVAGAQAESVALTLQVVPDTDSHVQGEPILMRLVARNMGNDTLRIPYRSNRDFASCDFSLEFRRDGQVLGRKPYLRSNVKRGGYSLAPGADRRFEVTVMPGFFEPSFEPLAPGTYEVVAAVTWGDQIIKSPPVALQISQPSELETPRPTGVDRALVNYVEQNTSPWPPCPESAATVLEQAKGSKLAAVINVRQLIDRWRRAKKDTENQPPEELRRTYEGLKRDLKAGVSHPRIGAFSGELLYALADVGIAQRELALRGEKPEREAMDSRTREEWRLAGEEAIAAVERLQKNYAESSFNDDACELLEREIEAWRHALEKYPDSPNAAEFRAALAAFERLSGKRSP